MEAGKNYKGHISVITDGGEFKILYDIDITTPYVKYGDQKIDDLFKFATLAESNWAEAARVFVRDDFKRTFINRDPVIKQIYNSLMESQSVNQALEEFLVYVHKKRALTLSVSKAKINLEFPEELSKISINISKNTWGYSSSTVRSTEDFIIPARKVITSADFYGNLYALDVLISPENIPDGVTSGRIIIENVYQTIEIEINLSKPTEKEIKVLMDPTFLFCRNEWLNMLGKASKYYNSNEKYILTYFIASNKADYQQRVKAYADKLGLPVWSIQFSNYHWKVSSKRILGASIEDFIALVSNAALILTDSFHGTAFSLNLQKDFVPFRHSANPLRIIDLLQKLGIGERLDMAASEYQNVNYSLVNPKLEGLREDSKNWVLHALKDET